MNLLEIRKAAGEIEIMIENGDFTLAAKENASVCLMFANEAMANEMSAELVVYWLSKAAAHLVGILHPMHARISSLAK